MNRGHSSPSPTRRHAEHERQRARSRSPTGARAPGSRGDAFGGPTRRFDSAAEQDWRRSGSRDDDVSRGGHRGERRGVADVAAANCRDVTTIDRSRSRSRELRGRTDGRREHELQTSGSSRHRDERTDRSVNSRYEDDRRHQHSRSDADSSRAGGGRDLDGSDDAVSGSARARGRNFGSADASGPRDRDSRADVTRSLERDATHADDTRARGRDRNDWLPGSSHDNNRSTEENDLKRGGGPSAGRQPASNDALHNKPNFGLSGLLSASSSAAAPPPPVAKAAQSTDASTAAKPGLAKAAPPSTAAESASDPPEKGAKPVEKPNFGLSGALASDTRTGNVFRGVKLKWSEPTDACSPTVKWRLYVFKGNEQLETPLLVWKQSA